MGRRSWFGQLSGHGRSRTGQDGIMRAPARPSKPADGTVPRPSPRSSRGHRSRGIVTIDHADGPPRMAGDGHSLLYVATVGGTVRQFLAPIATDLRANGWRLAGAASGVKADAILQTAFDDLFELPLSRSVRDIGGLVRGERAIARVLRGGPARYRPCPLADRVVPHASGGPSHAPRDPPRRRVHRARFPLPRGRPSTRRTPPSSSPNGSPAAGPTASWSSTMRMSERPSATGSSPADHWSGCRGSESIRTTTLGPR